MNAGRKEVGLAASSLSLDSRLRAISLTLQPGCITAFCGPNGAGKSSLLETLAGLLAPDSGSVLLDGAPLAGMTPRARGRRLAYLPQAAEIAWDVPVRRIVELGRMPHGDSDAGAVDAALAALDLAPLADRRAQMLSGGETARVLLARALAGRPEWLLADEPLAALDLAHQLALLRHLRTVADGGTGVVLVLHDLALAMNHADRVVVLDRGMVAADGVPAVALSSDIIARVWGVETDWLGAGAQRALVARSNV